MDTRELSQGGRSQNYGVMGQVEWSFRPSRPRTRSGRRTRRAHPGQRYFSGSESDSSCSPSPDRRENYRSRSPHRLRVSDQPSRALLSSATTATGSLRFKEHLNPEVNEVLDQLLDSARSEDYAKATELVCQILEGGSPVAVRVHYLEAMDSSPEGCMIIFLLTGFDLMADSSMGMAVMEESLERTHSQFQDMYRPSCVKKHDHWLMVRMIARAAIFRHHLSAQLDDQNRQAFHYLNLDARGHFQLYQLDRATAEQQQSYLDNLLSLMKMMVAPGGQQRSAERLGTLRGCLPLHNDEISSPVRSLTPQTLKQGQVWTLYLQDLKATRKEDKAVEELMALLQGNLDINS
ncbi:hypothetical protein [Parendozoicomonas haliclonae]|uniref:Uncharacterized protein n=1 Tax=Parendozoicomonas haliclonae TaxID=1960125 RepID=A0A1X7AKC5_9GAMM|nr:hypothetical protein [Parendozoicomonas haliclonae]SMA43539.1 hypothetical protein EHSB41UT_01618 [Parendozoicomonas haliclonae]